MARDGGVHEKGPGVDAAPQVGEITESSTPEVLRGMSTAYPVVALEHDGRMPIHAEQCIVVRVIKKARTVDPRKRALFVRADIDHLERRTALAINAFSSGADSWGIGASAMGLSLKDCCNSRPTDFTWPTLGDLIASSLTFLAALQPEQGKIAGGEVVTRRELGHPCLI